MSEREFLEQLHELNHKINFVKAQSFKDFKSALDVREILEKLKIKVRRRKARRCISLFVLSIIVFFF